MISSCVTDARALPQRGAEAVGAGVAAADDDDVLALRGDLAGTASPGSRPVRRRQELHGLEDAAELAPGDGEVARHGRPHGEDDGVVPVTQLSPGDVLADVHTGAEPRALRAHLLQPAVEQRFSILNSGMP